MDVSQAAVRQWSRVLGQVGTAARLFARSLSDRAERSTELFVVGAQGFEPWHFAAHLAEQAARCRRNDLVPTLLRWSPPVGAPPHLSQTVDLLASASRTQTVLVINPFEADPELLARLSDARRRGARLMTLHRGSGDLVELSHETLSVDLRRPARDFEIVQHLVGELTAPRVGRGSRDEVSATAFSPTDTMPLLPHGQSC